MIRSFHVEMASQTTYLMVSTPDDPSSVPNHPVIEDYNLDLHTEQKRNDGQCKSITFIHESTLEEQSDLKKPARKLSMSFPSATIVLHVVEERFDHIEWVQTKLYSEGKEAGEIEHGYIFNVGGE